MECVPQVLRQFIGNINPDIYFTGQGSFMAQSHKPNKMWEKFNLFHRAIRVIPQQGSTFQEHGDDWKQETKVLYMHEFTSY